MGDNRCTYLGSGLVWYCLPQGTSALQDAGFAQRVAESVALSLANAGVDKVPAHEIQASLAGCERTGDAGGDVVRVLAPELMKELDFCRWTGDGHFNPSQIADVSPPTLGQIVSFVRIVSAEKRVVLLLSSEKRRGAIAILAGAVSILSRPELEANIQAVLPKSSSSKAWDRFPPPFAADGVHSPSSLTVQDCLEGLQVARDLGWMKDYLSFDVAEWKYLREKFDMSWIIPGEMLAMGHPSLTAANPKFPGLMVPSKKDAPGARTAGTPDSFQSTTTPNSDRPLDAGLDDEEVPTEAEAFAPPGMPIPRSRSPSDIALHSLAEKDSPELNTPNLKLPVESSIATRRPSLRDKLSHTTSRSELDQLKDDTFASYFVRKDLGMIVRLNFEREYSSHAHMEAFSCVRCAASEFEDGESPSIACSKSFIALCRSHQESCESGSQRAIAVHCKAGLGRTGVQVGAYITDTYGVSGRVVHGWLRLVRPGSVQTPGQEHFLRSMRGTGQTSSGGLLNRLRNISWPSFQTLVSPRTTHNASPWGSPKTRSLSPAKSPQSC
mmetsp:Transcript_111238/g.202294  ORF Transcript_111238/g.202294 Transcript_111238/m.202294 type:complete len:552 (-) Transcript_111238:91-1746(-)